MIKAIQNCFVKEQVNLGRQNELDIAKGIAIIFMVFCHGFEILGWFFNPEIPRILHILSLMWFLAEPLQLPYSYSVWESVLLIAETQVPEICSAAQ